MGNYSCWLLLVVSHLCSQKTYTLRRPDIFWNRFWPQSNFKMGKTRPHQRICSTFPSWVRTNNEKWWKVLSMPAERIGPIPTSLFGFHISGDSISLRPKWSCCGLSCISQRATTPLWICKWHSICTKHIQYSLLHLYILNYCCKYCWCVV